MRTFMIIFDISSFVGFIVDFISVPVSSAFTSATSLIIIGSQMKHLFGVDYSAKDSLIDSYHKIVEQFGKNGYWDICLSVGCCIFLLVLRVS